MDRKSYLEEIVLLGKKLDSAEIDLDDIISRLDELYCFKPVSMKLLAVYSKVLLMKDKPAEVIQRFEYCYTVESKRDDNLMLWENIIEAYERLGRASDVAWHKYMRSKLVDDWFYRNEEEKLMLLRQQFVDGDESRDLLESLENAYYYTGDFLMAFVVRMYISVAFGTEESWSRYLSCANIMYIKERIDLGCTVIIVSDSQNSINYDILAYIFKKLNLSVYMISEPIIMDEKFELQTSVHVSMDNVQEFEDCTVIPSIARYEYGRCVGDNIPYLIDNICRDNTDRDFALVIASNSMLERLRSFEDIAKRFERLSDYYATYLEDKVGFAWSGEYYEYIGNLYNIDVRACVERTPEVKYSIVVPVRNATETLYHTLRTCIAQDYEGDYEVVLSDNSVEGHTVAYDTYKKLNSDKIKYYKTPRDLNLTKSYEYAYLQARGRYIFSIGADDGVMPWALKRLDFAWDKNSSDRNVLCWDRGFYAWPGFDGGQENQFEIPLHYNSEINGFINASSEYVKVIKNNPSMMYSLPNMYLNSGFKREYMKKIYDITGRLWDGCAQDIYTGVQNLALEEDFLYIEYPITLAGMSPSSVGALCRDASLNNNKKDMVNVLYGGQSINKIVKTTNGTLIPDIGTDISGLYICIEHLISKCVLPKDFYKGDEDIETLYIKCFESLSLLSDKFYKFVYEGYETAKRRSDKMANWFEQTIMASCDNKCSYFDKQRIENSSKKKMYVEGFNEKGGVTLDASRFGVTNVFEAVQLFKHFLHF